MEYLIQRAANALGVGVSVPDLNAELIKTNVSPEDAFLAIKAAEILLSPNYERTTLTDIPEESEDTND